MVSKLTDISSICNKRFTELYHEHTDAQLTDTISNFFLCEDLLTQVVPLNFAMPEKRPATNPL